MYYLKFLSFTIVVTYNLNLKHKTHDFQKHYGCGHGWFDNLPSNPITVVANLDVTFVFNIITNPAQRNSYYFDIIKSTKKLTSETCVLNIKPFSILHLFFSRNFIFEKIFIRGLLGCLLPQIEKTKPNVQLTVSRENLHLEIFLIYFMG